MTKPNLEERVSVLEAELRRLQEGVLGSQTISKDAWKLAVEKYSDDSELRTVFQAAKKIRNDDRKWIQSTRKRGRSA